MDCVKTGELIRSIRKEKNMTQKELADKIMVSDKAVSKWERGLGCPDVSLLCALSDALGINTEKMLEGDLAPNDTKGGNMKNTEFYVCGDCGNILYSTGKAELSCCGRKLSPLIPKKADTMHEVCVETVENDLFITFSHPMTKEHYIMFAAYVTWDKMLFAKLYPEQNGELRFPRLPRGRLYYYCSRDGFFEA